MKPTNSISDVLVLEGYKLSSFLNEDKLIELREQREKVKRELNRYLRKNMLTSRGASRDQYVIGLQTEIRRLTQQINETFDYLVEWY